MRNLAAAVTIAVALAIAAAPAHARPRPHYWHHPHGYFGWDLGLAWAPWWWWGPGPYGMVGTYNVYGVPPQTPSLAVVDTDVEPEHARVILNGTLIGVADDFDGYPDYLYLKPGHYTLEFTLGGYKSQQLEIDAVAGKYFPIDFKLQREPGTAAAPWWDRPEGLPKARVFGPAATPVESAAVARPDTTLRPELSRPDTAQEPPASTAPAPAQGQKGLGGAIEVRAEPANASVYLDGEFLGTAAELSHIERGVAVKAGHHILEVMAPGREAKKIGFEIVDGQQQQLVVTLDEGVDKTSVRH